jgi:hypothetical protein
MVFRVLVKPTRTFEARDRILALYAPIGLLCLPFLWLILVLVGFMLMHWSMGGISWRTAFDISGSSLFTLGFSHPRGIARLTLAFTQAIFGLGLLALLISFLPSIYSAFSRREQLVALLEVRAGNPPSVAQLMRRFYAIHGLEELGPMFSQWETWFADVEETHTSNPALVFFRSPLPNRSWLTSAGAVLDAASFAASSLDRPRDSRAELCIRAGYLCLRRIAGFFKIPFDADPSPDDRISIRREEYDAIYDQLAADSVPLKPDRDQAWRDFAGWRVNYDAPLVALAQIVMAPPAPWSSDRSPADLGIRMPRRFRRPCGG